MRKTNKLYLEKTKEEHTFTHTPPLKVVKINNKFS